MARLAAAILRAICAGATSEGVSWADRITR
jgi:hypothetical protein